MTDYWVTLNFKPWKNVEPFSRTYVISAVSVDAATAEAREQFIAEYLTEQHTRIKAGTNSFTAPSVAP